MTNTLRLADSSGNTLLTLRPAYPSANDPFIVESSTLPLAEPKVVQASRSGRSGADDLTELFGTATFSASVQIFDAAGYTRHQWADALRGLCAAHQRPWLYVQRDGWNAERRCQLRGNPLSYTVGPAAHTYLEASVAWDIPEGCLEDAVQPDPVTIRPYATQSAGTSLPHALPVALTPANTSGVGAVTVGGNLPVPPLIRLYGGFTDPVVLHVGQNKQIGLTGVSITAGQYIEIDVANKAIYLNGDPNVSYYTKYDWVNSEWWELQANSDPAGAGLVNQIRFTTATQDATCELDLYYRARYA